MVEEPETERTYGLMGNLVSSSARTKDFEIPEPEITSFLWASFVCFSLILLKVLENFFATYL